MNSLDNQIKMIYLIYSVTFSLFLSLSLNIFISMKIVINWIKDTIFTSSDGQRIFQLIFIVFGQQIEIKISNLLAKPHTHTHTLAEYNDEKNSTQKKVEIPTTEYSMFEKKYKKTIYSYDDQTRKKEKEKPH